MEMETSSMRWNSEEVKDSVTDHFEMDTLHFDTLDDMTSEQYLFSLPPQQSFPHSSSSESYNASFIPMDQELISSNNHINIHDSFERPAKQLKTENTVYSTPAVPKVTSSSHLISFGNASSQIINHQLINKDELLSYEDLNQRYWDSNHVASCQGTQRSMKNSAVLARPSNAPEHVIAERKRRERLTERFIALSAIVPGLKKLDKASVLGDAINYLKKLQERVDALEEEIKKKKSEDSLIVSQNSSKPSAASPDSSSSCDKNSGSGYSNSEIEVRISERNVLIRIHCGKRKGFIPKMLSEIEKLNLSVISNSVLPFGDYAMDITIVSQMEAEFSWTMEGLVRKLRSAFQ